MKVNHKKNKFPNLQQSLLIDLSQTIDSKAKVHYDTVVSTVIYM